MNVPRIILASASPRRRELLTQIGVHYEQRVVPVDERHRPGEAPSDYVSRLALAKARAVRDATGAALDVPVLGADTAVVLAGVPLGKPAGRAEALDMLRRLAGREHEVLSAVALVDARREALRLSRTRVRFRSIDEAELAAYWASGEPRDKAGAYAIQGRGALFVARIEGSYSGVVGLPLFETAELLASFGIPVLAPGRERDE